MPSQTRGRRARDADVTFKAGVLVQRVNLACVQQAPLVGRGRQVEAVARVDFGTGRVVHGMASAPCACPRGQWRGITVGVDALRSWSVARRQAGDSRRYGMSAGRARDGELTCGPRVPASAGQMKQLGMDPEPVCLSCGCPAAAPTSNAMNLSRSAREYTKLRLASHPARTNTRKARIRGISRHDCGVP